MRRPEELSWKVETAPDRIPLQFQFPPFMRQGGGGHYAAPGAECEPLPLPVQGADAYQAEKVSIFQKPDRGAVVKRRSET